MGCNASAAVVGDVGSDVTAMMLPAASPMLLLYGVVARRSSQAAAAHNVQSLRPVIRVGVDRPVPAPTFGQIGVMRRDLFEDFCREYVRELNRLRRCLTLEFRVFSSRRRLPQPVGCGRVGWRVGPARDRKQS